MENMQLSVNNGFCEHAKELWCRSNVKAIEILLTKATKICVLDGLTCSNWNNGRMENCPALKAEGLQWKKSS